MEISELRLWRNIARGLVVDKLATLAKCQSFPDCLTQGVLFILGSGGARL